MEFSYKDRVKITKGKFKGYKGSVFGMLYTKAGFMNMISVGLDNSDEKTHVLIHIKYLTKLKNGKK